MAWLIQEDSVLASVEIAATHRARMKGLLGRDSVSGSVGGMACDAVQADERNATVGALLLIPAKGVHTIGMKFAIDVAYLRRSRALEKTSTESDRYRSGEMLTFKVLATRSMRPGKIARPRLRSSAVLEAKSGAFERWNLCAGNMVQIVGW